MLPSEPPLSLHRLVAPVPPARPQEAASATHQTPPAKVAVPVPVPVPVSNATAAHSGQPQVPVVPMLMAGHDGVGNAAVAKAALQTPPAAPVAVVPVSPKNPGQPS
ncbi:hypothetical protein ACFV6E_24750 [Streptomyces sp. NPDC059785]|uniref:hypothetical protein n=1 Tax=Streptomyces sp. NPDC059785 TaxID=3346945 RepID=UPI00365CA783